MLIADELYLSINGRNEPGRRAAVLGSGIIAGIGFTGALLIADRAFLGARPHRGEARCADRRGTRGCVSWWAERREAWSA
jgi:hypothetical protein